LLSTDQLLFDREYIINDPSLGRSVSYFLLLTS
jgi:hypothetical protein